MASTKKVLKRVGIGIGALFLLLIVAAIAIPFFVNVDNYRPQIVEAVNNQINGKFELGPLKLTLWGQIKVEVGGFQLKDAQGRKVVAAKDVFFHVPWLSIFTGSPLLTFKMMKPEVIVIKDKNGKMNAMTIMKTKKETPPAAEAAPSSGSGMKNLPGIATRTRLGVEMRNALLDYQDASTGMSTKVQDLNVIVKDLSLSRPTEIEVWAELDTKMAGLTVKGPARMSAQGKPQFVGGEFKEALFSVKADLNDLEIMMPGLFEKRKGIVAGADSSLKVSPTAASIEKMELKFHNAVLNAQGGVTNLGAETSPVVEFKMKSNEIALKPWNALVPPLKDYDLAGTASMEANANGPTDKLQYGAYAAVKNLTAKAPNLKHEPHIDASIKVITDQVENMSFTFKAPGNDLKATGKIVSFAAPNANFSITSSGLDLDQLVEFPKTEKKAAGEAPAAKTAEKKADGKESNLDAALDPLRENAMLAGMKANIVFNLAMIKAYGVKMSDMQGQMSFRDLGFYVDRFRMGLWNGTISSTMGIQMKPKTPTYRFNADVAGLDIKQAVASQLELFKNTLVGIANFKMDASGASFNPEPAKGNLNAKGNMRVTNATFATIDIAKMAGDAINKAVDGISDKVPQLKGKKVGGLGNTESKYESVTADFTIQGGYFSAPNFFAKSEPGKGIDVRGDTKVGIKDYSLRAKWELVDTHNLMKARDLNVDAGGVRVEHILAEGDKPVVLPIEVGGTVFSPQPSYTSVPEALGKIALNNVAHAAGEKAKSEAKKAAEAEASKLIQKAPPAAQEALKGLSKKLFGK